MKIIIPLLLCIAAVTPTQINAAEFVVADTPWGKITSADIDAERSLLPNAKEIKANAMDAKMLMRHAENIMVNRALASELRAAGGDKDPDIQAEIKLAIERVLSARRKEKIEALAKPAKIDYTDRAKELYLTNQASFKLPDEIDTSHILLKVQCMKRAQREERIAAVKEAIAKGTEFGEIAAKYSDDDAAVTTKGRLGSVTEDKLVAQYTDGIKKLKVGEVSREVQTPYGIHFIKLHARVSGKIRSFDEVKAEIIENLAKSTDDSGVTEKLNQIKNNTDIKINEKEIAEYLKSKNGKV